MSIIRIGQGLLIEADAVVGKGGAASTFLWTMFQSHFSYSRYMPSAIQWSLWLLFLYPSTWLECSLCCSEELQSAENRVSVLFVPRSLVFDWHIFLMLAEKWKVHGCWLNVHTQTHASAYIHMRAHAHMHTHTHISPFKIFKDICLVLTACLARSNLVLFQPCLTLT